MSKVRDIIEAASEGTWLVTSNVKAAERFLHTFDPEHVALMEAVVEATREGRSGIRQLADLDAYRGYKALL